jgi:hypothetical protein
MQISIQKDTGTGTIFLVVRKEHYYVLPTRKKAFTIITDPELPI